MKKIILEARSELNEIFMFDITSKMNRNYYLEMALGKEVINSFSKIIEKCKRKILVTLDGFDTVFDEFRKESIRNYSTNEGDLERRSNIEINWVKSLLALVLEFKDNHYSKDRFSEF